MRKGIFLLLLSAAVFYSCVDIPDFDDTPHIEFNSIQKYYVDGSDGFGRRDTVIITYDFTDGDGDLGADTAEVKNPKYVDWGNIKVKTLVQNGNTFEELDLNDTEQFMWFPVLKPDGKPGPIKGKLSFGKTYNYTNSSKLTVIKYRVTIRDRALRVSNEVESDTISVPLSIFL